MATKLKVTKLQVLDSEGKAYDLDKVYLKLLNKAEELTGNDDLFDLILEFYKTINSELPHWDLMDASIFNPNDESTCWVFMLRYTGNSEDLRYLDLEYANMVLSRTFGNPDGDWHVTLTTFGTLILTFEIG